MPSRLSGLQRSLLAVMDDAAGAALGRYALRWHTYARYAKTQSPDASFMSRSFRVSFNRSISALVSRGTLISNVRAKPLFPIEIHDRQPGDGPEWEYAEELVWGLRHWPYVKHFVDELRASHLTFELRHVAATAKKLARNKGRSVRGMIGRLTRLSLYHRQPTFWGTAVHITTSPTILATYYFLPTRISGTAAEGSVSEMVGAGRLIPTDLVSIAGPPSDAVVHRIRESKSDSTFFNRLLEPP